MCTINLAHERGQRQVQNPVDAILWSKFNLIMLKNATITTMCILAFALISQDIFASPIAIYPALTRIYVSPDKNIPVKITFKNNEEPGYMEVRIENDPEIATTERQSMSSPHYLQPHEIVDVYVDMKTPKQLEDKDYLIKIYFSKRHSLLQDNSEVGIALLPSLRSDIILTSVKENSVALTPRTILLRVAGDEIISVIENKSNHLIEYKGIITTTDPKGRKTNHQIKQGYLRPFSQTRLSYKNIFTMKGKHTITQNIANFFGTSYDSIYHRVW